MKNIKLLFGLTLFLFFGNKLKAQVIREDARFLFYSERFDNGNYAFLNTDYITKDKVEDFYYTNSEIIIEIDKKIYYQINGDTMLYFDYSLDVGDTFYFSGKSIYPNIDSIIVDSVKNLMLEDGKLYKHWYVGHYIWVEGLGEKQYGWMPYDITSIPEYSDRVLSICLNDTLIYWNPGFKSFNNHPINPTCNYDTLMIYNSIDKVTNLGLKVYPNPANDYIEINSSQNLQEAEIKIFNVLGQEILNINSKDFPLKIDSKEWNAGIYFIKISNDKLQSQTIKFIKE